MHIERWAAIVLVTLVVLTAGNAALLAQSNAVWTGGGDGVSYSDPANWDVGVVPLNGGVDYAVEVPAGESLEFDVAGTGHAVFQWHQLANASFVVNPARELSVVDAARIDGIVTVHSGQFVANSAASILSDGNARLFVDNGGRLEVAAPVFSALRSTSETILSSTGMSSVLALGQLEEILYSGGGGRRVKTIEAANLGVVDLSGVTNISVTSGQDDVLDFRIASGGSIDLSSLNAVNSTVGNGNEAVRFFLGCRHIGIGERAVGSAHRILSVKRRDAELGRSNARWRGDSAISARVRHDVERNGQRARVGGDGVWVSPRRRGSERSSGSRQYVPRSCNDEYSPIDAQSWRARDVGARHFERD